MKISILLIILLSICGCNKTSSINNSHIVENTTEFEYWDGKFPNTIPKESFRVYFKTLKNKNHSIRTGIMVEPATRLHDVAINTCKDHARNQGWVEYSSQQWRREVSVK